MFDAELKGFCRALRPHHRQAPNLCRRVSYVTAKLLERDYVTSTMGVAATLREEFGGDMTILGISFPKIRPLRASFLSYRSIDDEPPPKILMEDMSAICGSNCDGSSVNWVFQTQFSGWTDIRYNPATSGVKFFETN